MTVNYCDFAPPRPVKTYVFFSFPSCRPRVTTTTDHPACNSYVLCSIRSSAQHWKSETAGASRFETIINVRKVIGACSVDIGTRRDEIQNTIGLFFLRAKYVKNQSHWSYERHANEHAFFSCRLRLSFHISMFDVWFWIFHDCFMMTRVSEKSINIALERKPIRDFNDKTRSNEIIQDKLWKKYRNVNIRLVENKIVQTKIKYK